MAMNGVNSSLELLHLTEFPGTKGTSSLRTNNNDDAISFNFSNVNDSSNIEDVESDYMESAKAIGKDEEEVEETEEAEETEETKAASGTQATSGTSRTTTESSEEIQEEIDKLEEEKEANEEKMEKIEEKIESLAKQAEENILAAAKAQESAVNEHEEESQKILDENINAYIAANKEGGEGMSRDELQQNIKGALPNAPEVADALAAMTAASEQINEIDSYLGELSDLIADTQNIEDQLSVKQEEYEAAKEAECCDPIGFTAGEGEDKAQYDFIVDDGSFDSTSDFLGAENQWAEMSALDTNGDQTVDMAELKAANIKAVKTDAEGNQSVIDLSEEFGEDFSIDLSSYVQGGSHADVDTSSDSDNDGTKDQSLLGTFNVNTGDGEEVKGYNTLDDTDWLSENYGISADTTTAEAGSESASTAGELNPLDYSQDLQPHVNFFNEYTAKSESLKESLIEAGEGFGITADKMNEINQATQREAQDNADDFFASLEKDEKAEEAKSDEEAKSSEETGDIEQKGEETTTNELSATDNSTTQEGVSTASEEKSDDLLKEELLVERAA